MGILFLQGLDMKTIKKTQFSRHGCINGLNERNLLGWGQLMVLNWWVSKLSSSC